MSAFQMKRIGLIMEPEPGNPHEVEGTLNPAAVRGHDGHLYLFPRLVARGNFSRIGIARVIFDEAGDPRGVERLGIELEPEADYELRSDGGGGCEDPRVTFVEPLQRFVMTYAALSQHGPRIALPNGIPCANTFLRVFAAIDPASFMECLAAFVTRICPDLEGKLVAIDGKALRGSRKADESTVKILCA